MASRSDGRNVSAKLSAPQADALLAARRGKLVWHYGTDYCLAGDPGTQVWQVRTLRALAKRGLLRPVEDLTGHSAYAITQEGREFDIRVPGSELPPEFTEHDAVALGRLAWRTYEIVAVDLPTRIHVDDFLDVMYSQLELRRNWLPADEALVARDAERSDPPRLAVAREIRGDRVARDVIDALRNYDDPRHFWAINVVKARMRESANSRGYLNP